MERIAELEPDQRGPYAGAVGYLGFDGALDTCITIRTATIAHGVCRIQAGAGIVADSDPAAEEAETRAQGACSPACGRTRRRRSLAMTSRIARR